MSRAHPTEERVTFDLPIQVHVTTKGNFWPGRYHGPWEDCYPDEHEVTEVEASVEIKHTEDNDSIPDYLRDAILRYLEINEGKR